MAHLALSLFGRFEARPTPPGRALHLRLKKARAILAILAWAPDQARARETLIGLLWSRLGQAQARNSFRVTLSSIRTALAAARVDGLRVYGDAVALNPSSVTSDVAAFRRLLELGAPKDLTKAVDLYRGDLLEGFDVGDPAFDEWLSTEREKLRMGALGACETVLAHQLRSGAHELALTTALRLVALDPLREPAHRAVMRLQARSGRVRLARRQYEICAAVLQRDLGVAPEAETRQLYEDTLRSDAGGRRKTGSSRGLSSLPVRNLRQVGRVDEMDRLRAALRAARSGHGQCVAVVGEAGIGKTRLVSELAAEALRRGIRVWLGRTYENDRLITFGPWVDAIRASGLVEDHVGLATMSPAWRAELGRLVPELGEPAQEGPRHPDSVRRLFEAVVQLVRHITEREPLLLVLEDLHWADELSVGLLAFLARRIRERPVMVLATMREEEVDARSALARTLDELDAAGVLMRVSMIPLTLADTTRLIHQLAHADRRTIDETGARAIWALSRGIPFMIVESVRALAERPSTSTDGGVPLPSRVRELVASRLDRLSERAQRLIQIAAVIGRAFEVPLLWRASGLGEVEAADGVEELTRRRLLHALGTELDVAHDWVRDVAYRALPPPLRQALHAAVARAIEEHHAGSLEPHHAALGRHYSEGEVWDKAVIYLHAAGRAAAARVGHREAVSRFEAALEVLGRLPESRETMERGVDLRLDLRWSLSGLGELEAMIRHLREAEPLARKLDDEGRLGWVCVYMGYYTRMIRRPVDAYARAATAHAIARKAGDIDLEIEADYELGMAHLFAGDHASAQNLLLRAFQTGASRLQRPRGRAVTALSARSYLGWSLAECGRFDEGLAHARGALDLSEQLDWPINIVIAHSELGKVYEIKGEFARAIPILERGLALGQDLDIGLLTPAITGWLATACSRGGRVADALRMLDGVVGSLGRPSREHVVVKLAEACLVSGRLEQAHRLTGRAHELCREFGLRGWHAHALRLLGEAARHGAAVRLDEAESHYHGALVIAEELGMRPLIAHCHLGLGKLYWQTGKRQEAQEHVSLATTMYREMAMTYWLEKADKELQTA